MHLCIYLYKHICTSMYIFVVNLLTCINIYIYIYILIYILSAIEGDTELEQCPPEYVSTLFDHYATKGN
jgi:hypothetical protein